MPAPWKKVADHTEIRRYTRYSGAVIVERIIVRYSGREGDPEIRDMQAKLEAKGYQLEDEERAYGWTKYDYERLTDKAPMPIRPAPTWYEHDVIDMPLERIDYGQACDHLGNGWSIERTEVVTGPDAHAILRFRMIRETTDEPVRAEERRPPIDWDLVKMMRMPIWKR